MTDPSQGTRFTSPTDASQIPTPSTSTRRPGSSALPSGNIFTTTGVPAVDQYVNDWQMQNFGRTVERQDVEMMNRIGETVMSSRNNPEPIYRGVPSPGLDSYNPDQVSLDIPRLIKHGFSGSITGAMQRWAAVDGALQFKDERDYDIFGDPQIKESPFADKPWMFANSGSRRETAWLINYMQRHQREEEYLSRMPGGEVFTMAGGLLGDPLTWTPATLGFKAARTAATTAMLNNPGNVALGLRPVVWGGIGDGLRASAAQMAIALTDAGLHHTLDPSHENGSIADIVALPGAIGASIGLLVGGHARYKLGMDAYKRAGSDTGFLGGTRPRSRQMDGAEGPMAPGELTPKEREYWDRATAKNPNSRYAIDGQVIGHSDDGVIFRTSEGIDVNIPGREIDQTSAHGAKGIIVSATELMRQDALKTSAYHLDGEFVGGATKMPAIYNPLDATIRPGSLATEYPTMRAAEAAKSGFPNLDDVDISRGSLSAGNLETDVHSRKAQLAGNRQVKTGWGIENLGLDVWSRASNSMLTTWQTTVADMISSSGRVLVKNTAAGGSQMSGNPIEILIRVNWNKPTNDVVREIRDMWEMARTGSTPTAPTDAHRIGFELKTTVKDWWTKNDGISHENFRRRVGDATINGDKDLITDANTPFIEQAAAKTRTLWEKIKTEAMDVGMFRDAHEEQVLKAEARVAAARKGDNADSLKAAEVHLEKVKQLLSDVITGGPKVNTAKSYRPRIWLQDQLHDRAVEFKEIVDDWLRQKNPNMSKQERMDAATNIHETLTRDRAVWTKEDVNKHFEDLADPGSAKARTFEIPDMLVRDFLENDIEALVRHHSRTMGTGIEMHRRFGSTGMEDQIAEMWNEHKLLLNAATTNAEKKAVMADYKLALSDLQATRDRLYGVYGAPDDPHRWQSRTVRMAKQFTNLTVLGMSGFTALGDLARPLMTEGLQAVHDYGFRTLASESRATILKMSRQELELAGDAMELIANTRALSMSDAGDMFRSRTSFERGLAKTNSWFFVMNGLNMVNQMDKEWAGVIIQGRMNRAILDLGRVLEVEPDALVKFGDKTKKLPHGVEDWMITRLAVNGIDADMIRRMAKEMNYSTTNKGIETAGSSRFGKLVLAHTENWSDETAQTTYRSALNQMVNRTVPTPTLGDTPNWFSTELGSLMTQYKAFSFGAMNRTLVSGLQEKSGNFWYSAAAMVGFAMVLNEIRSRWMYDRSTFDKPMTGIMMDAVDRSSILGWFSDANKAIEVLTGHRGGVRPWTGAEKPREETASRTVSALAGPAAGQAVNAMNVISDFVAGHPTARTLADARQLMPWQNHPFTDPVFDHLISDGKRWPAKEPTVNRRGQPQRENSQP